MTAMQQVEEVLVIGRGIYALPLLRILGTHENSASKKIKITLATSVGWKDVASMSRYVDHVVTVPRPDCDLEGFTSAICDIVRGKQQKLSIIPVAEETLYLSLPKVSHRIKSACPANNPPRILASSHDCLIQLHDKFQFQRCMAKLFGNENIPQTSLVYTQMELVKVVGEYFQKNASASRVVVKPINGHGSVGAHMICRDDYESFSSQELLQRYQIALEDNYSDDEDNKKLEVPYVVQEFVEGHEYSTLSVCINGQVKAHVCYKPRNVSTDGFSPIRDLAPTALWKKTLDYVQTVASSLKLTGHFGFDMIQRFNGAFAALECNPRVTNGLAFFSPRFSAHIASQIQALYLGGTKLEDNHPGGVISPAITYNKHVDGTTPSTIVPQHIMTMLPLVSSLAKAKNSSERVALLEVAVLSHDDVWWWLDPMPFVVMVLRILVSIVYGMLQIHFLQPLKSSTSAVEISTVKEYVRQQILAEVVSFDAMPCEATSNKEALATVGAIQDRCTSNDAATKEEKGIRVLVTGATGFLGGRLVTILNQGSWEDKTIPLPDAVKTVTSITATGRNVEKGRRLMEFLNDQSDGKTKVQFKAADLSNTEETYNLVKGHDVVIHCAALCTLWTRWDDYIAANTTATENIAQACQLCGIRLLVHVSTPSLCIPIDSDDRFGVKETDQLPEDSNQANRYSATKKMAESIVQDISKRYNLPAIILRPRAIFGPGDTTLFPLLLRKLRSGKLAVVGKGRDCFGDFTYVDNVVAACLCCLDKSPSTPKVYAITNDDPRRLWDIIDMLCDRMRLERPWKRIPRPVAYTMATLMEACSALAMLAGYNIEPLFTRYTVNVVSLSSTFDISAAKQDLGYLPVVPFDEGCDRFLDSIDQK